MPRPADAATGHFCTWHPRRTRRSAWRNPPRTLAYHVARSSPTLPRPVPTMPDPLHQNVSQSYAPPADATYNALTGTAAPIDPAQAVVPRAEALADPAVVRRVNDAAVKHNTFPSRPGYPSGSAHWQTHLHVEAWVRNTTYAKHLWADVHVFDHDGVRVASETCAFEYARPAGDGGDLFRLDCAVYEGTTVTPGSAEPRPDVRLVQYRIYVELDGRVFTDGLLHECVLRADVISR